MLRPVLGRAYDDACLKVSVEAGLPAREQGGPSLSH